MLGFEETNLNYKHSKQQDPIHLILIIQMMIFLVGCVHLNFWSGVVYFRGLYVSWSAM